MTSLVNSAELEITRGCRSTYANLGVERYFSLQRLVSMSGDVSLLQRDIRRYVSSESPWTQKMLLSVFPDEYVNALQQCAGNVSLCGHTGGARRYYQPLTTSACTIIVTTARLEVHVKCILYSIARNLAESSVEIAEEVTTGNAQNTL